MLWVAAGRKKTKIRKKKNVRTRLLTNENRCENELWIGNLRQTGIGVREREGGREGGRERRTIDATGEF